MTVARQILLNFSFFQADIKFPWNLGTDIPLAPIENMITVFSLHSSVLFSNRDNFLSHLSERCDYRIHSSCIVRDGWEICVRRERKC